MRCTLSIVRLSMLVLAVIVIPLLLAAQPGGQGGPPPEQGKPPHLPQEAIDACNEKSANAACEFSSPNGDNMTGTCEKMGEQLACRPIPPEAIDACKQKSEGTACEFSSPRGDTMTGTCQKKAEQLACTPKELPSHGDKNAPPDGQKK